VPPEILNDEGYSGLLSNMLITKTQTIDTDAPAPSLVYLVGGGLVQVGVTTLVELPAVANVELQPNTFATPALVNLGEEYFTDSPARFSIPPGAEFESNIITLYFDQAALKTMIMTLYLLTQDSRRCVLA
jgi:hypothetical protein